MAGKKVEGNEQQKRSKARRARRRGRAPSAEEGTTGAPRQRHHVGRKADHDERLETRQRGRQRAMPQ